MKTGLMVKDIDKEGLTIQNHDGINRLEARTVIWAGGVTVFGVGKDSREAYECGDRQNRSN